MLCLRCSRPAAFSTSSASSRGSHAAYMTSVNCAARGCGTAATFPPWSVQVNTRTLRAAPMEARPPQNPPPPPHRPHRTSPPHLLWMARDAPKSGTSSPSGNSLEVDVAESFLLLLVHVGAADVWVHVLDLCVPETPENVLLFLVLLSEWGILSPYLFMWCDVEHCLTRMLFSTFSITWLCDEDGLLLDRSDVKEQNGQSPGAVLLWSSSGSMLPLAWHSSISFVGRGSHQGLSQLGWVPADSDAGSNKKTGDSFTGLELLKLLLQWIPSYLRISGDWAENVWHESQNLDINKQS